MSSVDLHVLPGPLEREVEIVEHKGLGHPDTICDALAEELSVALCRAYRARFGVVLHHNVDKALLWGGASLPSFGGGEVTAPMEIYLAGRAVHQARGGVVPVEEIAVEGSRAWLHRNLHALDAERHVVVRPLVRAGSVDLVEIFSRADDGGVRANDTSCGVGFAPHTDLERVVLAVGDALRRAAHDPASPEVGEDTKVMGVRRGDEISLTIACAFVDRFVANLRAYYDAREAVRALVERTARSVTNRRVHVAVNAADREDSVFLTVTGTSAEAGDDGQVGRGNRVNGLITPCRPMTLEAAAGKNPVSHVGKLYSLAAHRMAASLVEANVGITHAECSLVSTIGARIDEPAIVDLGLGLAKGVAIADVRVRAEAIVAQELLRFDALRDEVIGGRVRVY